MWKRLPAGTQQAEELWETQTGVVSHPRGLQKAAVLERAMVHVLGGGLGLATLPSLYWSLSEPVRHLKLGARMDEEG